MRRLVLTQNITLDGVVEAISGWFGPAGDDRRGDQSDVLAELRRQDSAADGFLTGRRTFEDMRGYWPQQTDDTTGITAYLDQVQKYVVSSTLTDPAWEPTEILPGADLAAEVTALKERDRPGERQEIVVTGSITLCHDLLRLGLVDEVRLFVHPVVVGRGRRLFREADGPVDDTWLTLLETRAFTSGVTLQRYAVA
ncbi:dihydrofolate reductase family protein [Nocardioides alkalitolerans]|uniref:dihydrofolate reductase family protein n=1 Tax=Nocardioides alkalitolerans TaxID=281714 RepID=UPI00040008EC|nr:dihydrofolate reductase family protein [Nocardioides alkalitolerans]